ncbi:MAG: HesA/MoeB/ThiF family protein [Candidatus Lernaella stagnicola]|nr:HesA/MoeB/ThiF family protein [Candidatus Lernaella stagnicola]
MTAGKGRYHAQELLPFWGSGGQERLAKSAVLIAGCGGLGGHAATLLARAGVGHMRLVDHDTPELSNLHRQVLFFEQDVRDGTAKAVAAADVVRRANSDIVVDARVEEINAQSLENLLDGIDLVVDATDNFPTRFALNEACVRRNVPWIYGGAVGTSGSVMVIVPRDGPCLRCVYPQDPDESAIPHSSRNGIIGTLPAIVAAQQATEALRLLLGEPVDCSVMRLFDIWEKRYETLALKRQPACPVCGG